MQFQLPILSLFFSLYSIFPSSRGSLVFSPSFGGFGCMCRGSGRSHSARAFVGSNSVHESSVLYLLIWIFQAWNYVVFTLPQEGVPQPKCRINHWEMGKEMYQNFLEPLKMRCSLGKIFFNLAWRLTYHLRL